METRCEHHIDVGDEHFLFDDENSFVKKCIKCQNSNGLAPVMTIVDDPIDSFEDAPLLINEFQRQEFPHQPQEEFHCHVAVSRPDDKNAHKKLLIASLLCFLFMNAELIGGFIASSLAIMTDAAHLFSDFVGFLISLLSLHIAHKPPSKTMTFGYHRVEVLGAFLSVLTVWLLAGVFAVLAIERLFNADYDIDADTMMLVASLGLIVNFIMGAVLHGVCNHNHSHGAVTSDTNINVRAAAAHVLGDLLQSFGVLVASIVIKIFPNAQVADPICTLIFSVIVVCTTAKVAKDSVWLLVEGSPGHVNEIAVELQSIESVRSLHNLHIWTLSPGKDVVLVHLCVDKYTDRDLVLRKANSIIRSKLSVVTCSVQIETYNAETIDSCKSCQQFQC